jgi:hypothetical protein
MTPAKLSRKTRNRLRTYAKAAHELVSHPSAYPEGTFETLFDLALRCYTEGYTTCEYSMRGGPSREPETLRSQE